MRHSKRHLAYAASAVLGLTASTLAAVVLTSAPTSATPAPVQSAEPPALLHVPVLAAQAVTPPSTPAKPAVRKPATRRVVTVAPATRRAVRRTPVVAPKPVAPRPVAQTAQPMGANDYPYKSQQDFYAIDRWGFTQRQCVSFAAWRLAQHGDTISNDGNQWGSAFSWDEAARRLGHVVTSKPRVGAVAHWNQGESSPYYSAGSAKANGRFAAGGYGHVGWVKQVYSDGSVLVEQYNMGDSRSYSVMRVKAPRYLVV